MIKIVVQASIINLVPFQDLYRVLLKSQMERLLHDVNMDRVEQVLLHPDNQLNGSLLR